jgi:hypothetical protein
MVLMLKLKGASLISCGNNIMEGGYELYQNMHLLIYLFLAYLLKHLYIFMEEKAKNKLHLWKIHL